MSKKIIELTDMNGRKYHLKDPQRFYDHLQEFHASGRGICKENRFYFRVNDAFQKKINGLINSWLIKKLSLYEQMLGVHSYLFPFILSRHFLDDLSFLKSAIVLKCLECITQTFVQTELGLPIQRCSGHRIIKN